MDQNLQQYYGLKELYSVVIRAYSDMKIGNHFFEKGEPVLYFEKLQISQLSEKGQVVSARGGHGNYPHVVWENFGDVTFNLTEGVLSKMSFGILSNAEVFDYNSNEKTIKVPKKESVMVENSKVTLLQKPLTENLYIYKFDEENLTTKRIKNYKIFGNDILFEEPVSGEVIVDYYYNYTNAYTNYILSNKRINGLFSLEGKAYFKNENTGMNQTFLFEIPKMKVTSNIDMIMGEKASPTVSVFSIIGLPIKENNQFVVSKMYLLSNDIDGTI